MKYKWNIIGHNKQLLALEKDIATNNLSHAYILSGPKGIGKYSIAKKLAGILQCENDFCHECSTCLQVSKGAHLDTIELADVSSSIGIDLIKDVFEKINLTKQSKWKIVLVKQFERATKEAANTFLKTLEEPPSKTIFIMTADSFNSLMPTIISRARILKFSTIPHNILVKSLEEKYSEIDKEIILKAALLSLGKAGRSFKLLEDSDLLQTHLKTYHDIIYFLENDALSEKFTYIENLIGPGENEQEILERKKRLEMFFNITKLVLRTKILEGKKDVKKFVDIVSFLDEAGVMIKKNVNLRLVLENLILKF